MNQHKCVSIWVSDLFSRHFSIFRAHAPENNGEKQKRMHRNSRILSTLPTHPVSLIDGLLYTDEGNANQDSLDTTAELVQQILPVELQDCRYEFSNRSRWKMSRSKTTNEPIRVKSNTGNFSRREGCIINGK